MEPRESNASHNAEYNKEYRKNRATRTLEIINYVIFPLQYLTKDLFLLFNSYNACLNIAIPTLRFINKRLSWLFGASFVLEGLCALIESTHEDNENKRSFLLGQALFLVIGGSSVIVLAFTNPQIYIIILCIVWGSSTALFLYDITRDYLKNKSENKKKLQVLKYIKNLLGTEALLSTEKKEQLDLEYEYEKSHIEKAFEQDDLKQLDTEEILSPIDSKQDALEYHVNRVSNLFDQACKELMIEDIDFLDIQGEIMESISTKLDSEEDISDEDIEKILVNIMEGSRFTTKSNKNIFISAAYIGVSFISAVAFFIFLGDSNVEQTIIFSHLIITAGMVFKRAYDFISNPLLFKVQMEDISSRDIDQLNKYSIKNKYLKRKLQKLAKKVARPDSSYLRESLQEYARIVKEANEKDSPYTKLICELSSSISSHSTLTEDDVNEITKALRKSIQSRLIFIGCNHSCILCKVMEQIHKKRRKAKTPAVSSSELRKENKMQMFTKKEEYTPKKVSKNFTVREIAEQCKQLLEKKSISRKSTTNEEIKKESPNEKKI